MQKRHEQEVVEIRKENEIQIAECNREMMELREEYESRISDLERQLLVTEAKLEVQTANVSKQKTTNITFRLGSRVSGSRSRYFLYRPTAN